MYSTANLSDVELKEQGNRLFSTRKYEDAISCYSKAIVSIYSIRNCACVRKCVCVRFRGIQECYLYSAFAVDFLYDNLHMARE